MEEQRKKSGEDVMVAKKGYLNTDQTNHLENIAKIPPTNVCRAHFSAIVIEIH